jgi:hypothetical protein
MTTQSHVAPVTVKQTYGDCCKARSPLSGDYGKLSGRTSPIFRWQILPPSSGCNSAASNHKKQAKLLSLIYSGFLKTEVVRSPETSAKLHQTIRHMIWDSLFMAYDGAQSTLLDMKVTKNVQYAGSASQDLILLKYDYRTASKSLNSNPGLPEYKGSSMTMTCFPSVSLQIFRPPPATGLFQFRTDLWN